MGKSVLFTPVGGTDPISWNNLRDGAILQICRKYKPDLVYLYMSAEIMDNQHKDSRYTYCLEQLAERIGHKFEIICIERPELREVQRFDFFYGEFTQLLEEISAQLGNDDELLLNVSSGTPAMKSTLMVLSSLTRMKCKVIQVKTPIEGMNEHNHPVDSIEELWECNEDKPNHRDCPIYVLELLERVIAEDYKISSIDL